VSDATPLPIIRPDLRHEEVEADIRAILSSGILTGGPYVARFEAMLAERLGVGHVVATTSATTALHLALAVQGVGPGDEVLVSDFTFPASGNAIVELGAVPVPVDSRPDRFALDLDDARAKVTGRTRAIMAVHPFGQPVDGAGLAALAGDHGLAVVEDAACALGSSSAEGPCGSQFPGAFSFHPRKVVTTGEGGALSFRDGDLADRARRLRSHGGIAGEPGTVGLRFVENGYNYRLAEIPAALGLAQLRRLDEILADRQATARRYEERLADVEGVELRTPPEGDTWSYQSFVVVLADHVDRDALVASLRAEGIETTLGTYAMHAHPAFERFGLRPGDLPNSFRAQQQSLTLPLLPRMDDALVDRVVEALARLVPGAARG
jgi:perosamine synthetase